MFVLYMEVFYEFYTVCMYAQMCLLTVPSNQELDRGLYLGCLTSCHYILCKI